jgi:glutamine phosphoribosylpyrophosphate amidotransferase
MCGIFGIITRTSVDPALYTELGILNTRRGNLAFGGVIVTGDSIRTFRHAMPFDGSLVELDGAHTVLSHIRAPTGSQSDSIDEVHPFETADLLLAHNGLLLNHEAFPQWRINPVINVDSQVIVGGIQHHLDTGLTVEDAICHTVETLNGQQACWLWHKPTGSIYLWRVMSAVYCGQQAERFVFSSVQHPMTPSQLDEGILYHLDRPTLGLEPVGEFAYYSPYRT